MSHKDQILKDLLGKWTLLRGNINETAVLLAVQICGILQNEERYAELDMFLKALPLENIYTKNEYIVRAKIAVAFEKRNFPLVYYLIEKNTFQNCEDLINIWDKAHYAEEEERAQKPLTSLLRFRIRQRNMPPESICPTRKRKKATLPVESKSILQDWLNDNIDNPYPSKDVKKYLAEKANLTPEQVKTWFANARRRMHSARYERLYRERTQQSGNERSYLQTSNHLVTSDTSRPCNTESYYHNNNEVGLSLPSIQNFSMAHVNETLRGSPLICLNDNLSFVPELELVQPDVSLTPNLNWSSLSCSVCGGLPRDTTHLFAQLSRHKIVHSCGNARLGIHQMLDQAGSCCVPRNGYHGYHQNIQDVFKEPLPDISMFQNNCQQMFFSTHTQPLGREPLNCHQQVNTMNQDSESSHTSSTVGTREVSCGSPGQVKRFNAATALIDMSVEVFKSTNAAS